MSVIYPIIPVSKPRMTQRDKWKKRPCALRYRAFKDECRLHNVHVPENSGHIIFYVPMPKSWSGGKRQKMNREPHRQKPDIDNLAKALLDAVFKDDSHINDLRVTKLWAEKGSIEIRKVRNEYSI